MSWTDRPYQQDSGYPTGGGGPPNWVRRLVEFFNWSFPIGTYLRTRVSVHVTFLLLVIFQWVQTWNGWWTLRGVSLLFFSVLLHEFGHVLGCRQVGGHADRILMWPLGGLAFCVPPHRPWPGFVTAASGPLVSLLIAAGAYAALWFMPGVGSMPTWNPLAMWSGGFYGGLPGFVSDLFYVNYLLLLFNMALMFLPFDGGRIVQTALWAAIGYRRSIAIATMLGMIGAVIVGLIGLLTGQLFLLLIAVFGFYSCYQERRGVMMQEAAETGGDPLYAAAYERWESQKRPPEGRLARWRENRQRQKTQRAVERQEQAEREVDRILEKVSAQGLQSLTEKEKRTLQKATDNKRAG